MNDGRTIREISALRAQRHDAALIAQYVHEQSERHAGARQGSSAPTGHPRAGGGVEQTAGSQEG